MKKEMYFEEAMELRKKIRENSKKDVEIEVLTRKIDREGRIIPDKVLITL